MVLPSLDYRPDDEESDDDKATQPAPSRPTSSADATLDHACPFLSRPCLSYNGKDVRPVYPATPSSLCSSASASVSASTSAPPCLGTLASWVLVVVTSLNCKCKCSQPAGLPFPSPQLLGNCLQFAGTGTARRATYAVGKEGTKNRLVKTSYCASTDQVRKYLPCCTMYINQPRTSRPWPGMSTDPRPILPSIHPSHFFLGFLVLVSAQRRPTERTRAAHN